MAYDEAFAERIRAVIGKRARVTEKKMFGGLAFLLDGKMFCGIAKGLLMLRVGPERYDVVLKTAHVRPMDFTGRPLKGYVYVEPEGLKTKPALAKWVSVATDFVSTLEATPKKTKKNLRKG